MNILAIETSCDDTAIAIVKAVQIHDGQAEFQIISNVANSQIEVQRQYGGVYPHIARREHALHIPELLQIACNQADFDGKESTPAFSDTQVGLVYEWLEREPELRDRIIELAWSHRNVAKTRIDTIAVTIGPGLAPALWIGVNVARTLAYLWNIPLVAVNHMAGHALSGLWPHHQLHQPALALLVSGGHTEIDLIKSPTDFKVLGKTVDDAAGEAFDKVARMLDLPYPGGPEVSKLATEHRTKFPGYEPQYNLPLPMQHSGDLNFSFSGLKTAVMRAMTSLEINDETRSQICREFETAVVEILIYKLDKAIVEHRPKQLLAGGGVIANNHLRQSLELLAEKYKVELRLSPIQLAGDNALMIAMSGYWQAMSNDFTDPADTIAKSSRTLNE